MTSSTEHAAIVRKALLAANEDVYGDDGNRDAFAALDALEAQAEQRPSWAAATQLADRAEAAEEREKNTFDRLESVLAERDRLEQRIVELVEGHDLERLSAERDRLAARVEELEAALRYLLEWAEKDRGGGYPEADRSEEWYTHRDFARAALNKDTA